MNAINQLFLEALAAGLRGERVQWENPLEAQDWAALLKLAQAHHVLPMIFEAVYACPAARSADAQLMLLAKRQTMQSVMMQAMKTGELLTLVKHLRAAGVTPCVVKGAVCRSLYPSPDHRISGDEDVLIPPEQFECCHEAMLAFGMRPADPQQDILAAHEVPYGKPGSPLYIELHKHLFPPESDAYGDFNRFFADAHAHTTEIVVDGAPLTTLSPTDHFFYLICHAFKHFLHSGFGIRQVCDIVLFADRYGQEIDWASVLENCREIRAEQFTAALLRIGQKHFGFDPEAAGVPQAWQEIEVDEGPMLSDLLDSGVFGDASMSRKHSSTMTLSAVAADKRGKKAGGNVLRTIFPGRKALEGRYPFLRTKPWLLPVAWVRRIAHYAAERRGAGADNSAAESLRIGSERVELLRRYGIIK
ncbi:MAG: nucleotidyltransferase family protein [Candidatus Ventricola sp.]|nr:nucleotidyltransferase family protein [Candidatus Ventricola sp.]